MLVNMKRSVFGALDDRALVWQCIEPTITRLRGKSPEVKDSVYLQLSDGQQALMLFQILYGHARSPAEFYWFACDYLSQGKLWSLMKERLKSFGCDSLVEQYREIERRLGPRVAESLLNRKEIAVRDLDHDPGLLADVNRMYEAYRAAAGEAIGVMARQIRDCPENFLVLEED